MDEPEQNSNFVDTAVKKWNEYLAKIEAYVQANPKNASYAIIALATINVVLVIMRILGRRRK